MTTDTHEREESSRRPTKHCFVTIGATAAFDGLLKAVLEDSFLQALHRASYTHLLIQYGKAQGKEVFDTFIFNEYADVYHKLGIEISGFAFNPAGLQSEMRQAKADSGTGRQQGLIVSHAGSGSILEALRIGVPLLVVPNADLLHNHQAELAEELARQEYIVHGSLHQLASALPEAERLRHRQQQWPPPNHGAAPASGGLAGVIAEEMSWVD